MARSTVERHQHPKYERLYLLRRAQSKFYYAEAFLDGRKVRHSLKTPTITLALKLAEEWYRKQLRASREQTIERLASIPTVSEVFNSYRETLIPSKQGYADMKWSTIQHFWRGLEVSEINAQTFRDFYKWRRRTKTPQGTTIKNHSLHKDVMVIRQVLKFAIEEEHLTALPIIPKVGKIAANPRPWLTHEEFDTLIEVSDKRIATAKKAHQSRVVEQRQSLQDFLLFMMESLMRVSELRTLTVRQCRAVAATPTTKAHLIVDAKGKTGHRTVVAGGVAPAVFRKRSKGLKAGDRLFPHNQRDAFRELLIAAKLREDSFGQSRNLKSMRATAISFRVLSGAPTPNLLMIARNAGTSVAMIDNFYARKLSAEMGAASLSQSNL